MSDGLGSALELLVRRYRDEKIIKISIPTFRSGLAALPSRGAFTRSNPAGIDDR
jgi:hypothetical protein